MSSADLRRLGKTLPPGSPRGGGEERRYDLADFQRLLGAGRRKGGEGVKFALGRRQSVATTAATEENILPRASGAFPSKEWRVDFFYEGIQMSPWHDIPVYVGAPSRREVHMVVEIVRCLSRPARRCGTKKSARLTHPPHTHHPHPHPHPLPSRTHTNPRSPSGRKFLRI